jgi:phosphoribosylamine--glycine ligase
MKVLVIGGGGREHALAWRLAQSPRVSRVYVAPGNAGTAREPKVENIAVAADDVAALLQFAKRSSISLTVVGPEAPLVAGIVDTFHDSGLACFGPSREAAQLEGSKAFTKDFLARHRIPTAAYKTFTELDDALAHVRTCALPVVIKADGLAAGKGVVIAHERELAQETVTHIMSGAAFGADNRTVVIEDFLEGEEASFIVMVDGEHVIPLATSQDHKARDDGDSGPNTGGMGAYSPAPVVTPALHARIMKEIIEPTVRGMAADGHPYTGFLYAGLMISPAGDPKVLEYNCRLGDPEAQVLLMRMKSNLAHLCQAALNKRLDKETVEWDTRCSLGVVLAAGGYPDAYHKGDVITGLPDRAIADVKVFHAGTALEDGNVVTAGGRVLCVCALGDSVQRAQARAYDVARRIRWSKVYFRNDIGYRAVARETGGVGSVKAAK